AGIPTPPSPEGTTAAAGGASCPACSRTRAPAAGGGTRRNSDSRTAPFPPGAAEPGLSDQCSWSLRVQLHDELFLGVNRNGFAGRTFGQPAGRLVRIHREPGHLGTAGLEFLRDFHPEQIFAGGIDSHFRAG